MNINHCRPEIVNYKLFFYNQCYNEIQLASSDCYEPARKGLIPKPLSGVSKTRFLYKGSRYISHEAQFLTSTQAYSVQLQTWKCLNKA